MMGASTPRSSWPCLAAFRPHFAYDDVFIHTETPKQKIQGGEGGLATGMVGVRNFKYLN